MGIDNDNIIKWGIEALNMKYDYFDYIDKIIENRINDFLTIEKINLSFPNAILVRKTKKKKSIQKVLEIPKIKKKENVWDLLDKITTESEKSSNISDKICKGCQNSGCLYEDNQASTIVCTHCGMVNDEMLDHCAEWRQYNSESNDTESVGRCGMPSNFFFPKSSQGTIMTGINNIRLKRKQKWNSMEYKEKSLNDAFEDITSICVKNNIPKIIIDTAKILCKKISDCKHREGINAGKQIIIRGENRWSIIAACVFRACQMNKSPRSIKEIAKIFGLNCKKVTKGNKHFDRIIRNLDDNTFKLYSSNMDTVEDYVRRHCPKLLGNGYQRNIEIAIRIAQNCCKMKLASDHNPKSIAAASILLMVYYCNLSIDKKEIAEIFGTSSVTITKIFNKISPYIEALIDNDLTNHLIEKFKING